MSVVKTKFIKKYGTKVTVRKWDGVYISAVATYALLGRGSKVNSSMRLLETQREGILPADTDIDSGYYVDNDSRKETFIVGGTLPEYGRNETLSIVVNLLICNSLLTVKGQKKVADTRGNVKTEFITTCADLPCHLLEVSNELRLSDAGVLPDTEYLVYAPLLEVMETDQLSLMVKSMSESFKVLSKDYVTFPNMVVLQASRDIRK